MNRKRRWTDEELITAVKNNYCISDILKQLGFPPIGSYYKFFKKHIVRLNLDISHFKSIHRGGTKELSNNQIFVENSPVSIRTIRDRIKKYDLLDYKCVGCGISEWKSQITNNKLVKITLQLDHINGNCNDNKLSNLRYLCGICHSLTDTFGGRNVEYIKNENMNKCSVCNGPKYKTSKLCKKCVKHPRKDKFKIEWPSIEKLTELLQNHSYLEASRQLGVSDNAIRKHLKRYSIS